MQNIFFNAQHAPLGAYATFTLGYRGASGGLGFELARPADQNIYLGLETEKPFLFEALPFFAESENDRARFADPDPEGPPRARIRSFAPEEIQREFHACTDVWRAGDLTFSVYTPLHALPDPDLAPEGELKKALVPAVFAELVVDNRRSRRPRRAFFGFQGSDPHTSMRRLADSSPGRIVGVAQGRHTGLAAADPKVQAGLAFSLEELLGPNAEENFHFGLGTHGALVMRVEPGEQRSFRFVLSFYRGGWVTSGIDACYYYTRFFRDLEDVAGFGLQRFEKYKAAAVTADRELEQAGLSSEQYFMLALAVRSYYANSELLDFAGRPFWIVNEGEYRMLNTLDLTVDHVFFELRYHPWTVRNVLDRYAERYAYRDQVRWPGEERLHPGGLSFTHDMGVANTVTRPGTSAYERFGTDGCFSFMTHEELLNWILCAAMYYEQTQDGDWLRGKRALLLEALESLVRRDHYDPAARDGVMSLDSALTRGRGEITTYDSHDASLKQARHNLYLAVKTWAGYVVLEWLLGVLEEGRAAQGAGEQADRCARTVTAQAGPGGALPAILALDGEAADDARIIPAAEGLLIPYLTPCRSLMTGTGRFAFLVTALKNHLQAVLVPGVCLLADGGWKISSSFENTWLSKTYLCQYIAREILGLPWGETGAAADRAHVSWLLNPETAYWAWCDQMVAGAAKAARYYPRGVTSFLWLEETRRPAG